MISFTKFDRAYQEDDIFSDITPNIYPTSSALSKHVSTHYSGKSYRRGLYRFHSFSKCDYWTNMIISIFPEQKGRLFCFSYDWLGRQFAFDPTNLNTIYMVDIDQAEILSLQSSLEYFHNVELVEKADDILAARAFDDFFGQRDSLKTYKSVGYKIPLFLGGKDNKENQEIVDMDVYWSIGAQLLDKIKPLAEGTRVSSIKLL